MYVARRGRPRRTLWRARRGSTQHGSAQTRLGLSPAKNLKRFLIQIFDKPTEQLVPFFVICHPTPRPAFAPSLTRTSCLASSQNGGRSAEAANALREKATALPVSARRHSGTSGCGVAARVCRVTHRHPVGPIDPVAAAEAGRGAAAAAAAEAEAEATGRCLLHRRHRWLR